MNKQMDHNYHRHCGIIIGNTLSDKDKLSSQINRVITDKSINVEKENVLERNILALSGITTQPTSCQFDVDVTSQAQMLTLSFSGLKSTDIARLEQYLNKKECHFKRLTDDQTPNQNTKFMVNYDAFLKNILPDVKHHIKQQQNPSETVSAQPRTLPSVTQAQNSFWHSRAVQVGGAIGATAIASAAAAAYLSSKM